MFLNQNSSIYKHWKLKKRSEISYISSSLKFLKHLALKPFKQCHEKLTFHFQIRCNRFLNMVIGYALMVTSYILKNKNFHESTSF